MGYAGKKTQMGRKTKIQRVNSTAFALNNRLSRNVADIMKRKVLAIVFAVLCTTFCKSAAAINNYASTNRTRLLVNNTVGNTAGNVGAGPAASIDHLYPSINPLDNNGNLIITGNVSGGKHFRGVVPYNAISDFAGSLGSTSLDSFLRYSAGATNRMPYSGKVRRFYSPTRTVTTTQPGRMVIRPPSIKIAPFGTDEYGNQRLLLTETKLLTEQTALQSETISRPMSPKLQQIEKMILQTMSAKVEESRQKLEKTTKFTDELFEKPQTQNTTDEIKKTTDEQQPAEINEPNYAVENFENFGLYGQQDIFEQMKEEIKQLSKPSQPTPRPNNEYHNNEYQGRKSDERFDTKIDRIEEISQTNLSARAKIILGPHKTFASFAKDRFNKYIRAAEAYLKQGEFYRAADAYTMALVYKPGNPLAYAGKSHALFASGEYMSSALFLRRALNIFPEYAKFKIDIETMVGDRDTLETRLADVEQWAAKSGSGELYFLMAYVYHQIGRQEKAKECINAAYEKMPDEPAVLALKKAFNDAGK